MARFKEIYKTTEWLKARQIAIDNAKGLCEECSKHGIIEAGKEVDHIIEITHENKGDWNIVYNPANLQYLCSRCHNIKHGRCTNLHNFIKPI